LWIASPRTNLSATEPLMERQRVPGRRFTGQGSSAGTGLGRQESGHVPTLPRRLDCASVVVLPHEGHRLLGWYAVQVRDASKGSSGPSTTARTGELHPLILSSKPRFA